MHTPNIKKIKNEIRLFGIPAFFMFKMNELYYSLWVKKMGIFYPDNQSSSLDINKLSANIDRKKNQSSSYYKMKMAFSALGKNYSGLSLLDIGCGDGKVINFAMLLNFKNVTGIDLDESAVERAIKNCSKMKEAGCSIPFDVYCADAAKYIIPPGTDVIFMFNPFGRQTMQAVLNNIIHYCDTHKTEVHIIYIVPVHRDLFDDNKRLCNIYQFPRTGKITDIVIYKAS